MRHMVLDRHPAWRVWLDDNAGLEYAHAGELRGRKIRERYTQQQL